MGKTETRLAVPEDEAAVQACVNGAYGLYLDRMSTAPAPMLDDYGQLIDRGVVHLAVEDTTVLGLVVMWPKDDHLYVDNIAVDPSSQGKGVGKVLIDLAQSHARIHHFSEVRLYTNEAMTENLDYYPRRGFVETHRGIEAGYQRVYFSLAVDQNR